MNDSKFVIVGSAVMGVILIVVITFGVKLFNAATVNTKIITPSPGIECVIASATDSVSVSCYRK